MEEDRTVGESRQGEKREGNNEWNRTGLQERADRERGQGGIMNDTGQLHFYYRIKNKTRACTVDQ